MAAPELSAPAPSPPLPIVLELQMGWQSPLGTAGLALVFDRGGRLSAGLGLGLEKGIPNAFPAVGLFGRARLLRVGPVWLGATAAFSRVHVESGRQYERPPAGAYAPDQLNWSWEPGYRASGALATELAGRRWSFRLEGGVGYLLNQPRCFLASTILSSDCAGSHCDQSAPGQALAFALLLSVPVLVGYEILSSPASARRANARNGIVDLGVTPTVATSSPTQSRGLALAGRF